MHKPFTLFAMVLTAVTCLQAQPLATTATQDTARKEIKLNYVLSWNGGIYSFPKSYSTVDINLPYTTKVEPGGDASNLVYKARIANYFTKTASALDVIHTEFQGSKQGVDLTLGFSPNYSRNLNGGHGNMTLFFSAGYEWLKPLTKRPGNTFFLKPCISAGIYQFDIGFDSTIDNNQKTVVIAGETFGPTFTHYTRYGSSTEQSSYLELFYQNTNYVLIPQLTLAHQGKRHTIYYSITAGWVQRFAGDGGHVVIWQWDDGGHMANRTTVVQASPYHFSGPIAKLGVGFYFDKTRPTKRRPRAKELKHGW